jgi:hypothetical protein
MSVVLISHTISNPNLQLILLVVSALLLAALAAWVALLRRMTTAERERRRRLAVNRIGRMGDVMITDVHEDVLYYTYSIRGVDYAASQEVSSLRGSLPGNLASLIGPATLKYAPRNPGNSIIVCEGWSGLYPRSQSESSGLNLTQLPRH